MNIRLLAGVACAALSVLPVPAFAAATIPEVPGSASGAIASDPAVDAFYASRHGAPLWLAQGAASPAAQQLISVLERAQLDGLAAGPAYAASAQALLSRAQAGDKASAAQAERLLSAAWVQYVQTLQRPAAGMTYESTWVQPRVRSAHDILALAGAAQSLPDYVRAMSDVNPIYASLRATAAQQLQGGAPDPRVLASLDQARTLPARGRYVLVDAATQTLSMVQDGHVADTMKVIVGKPGSQTPMIASVIYAATLNPYWHVPVDLEHKLIAPRVVAQGVSYLKDHRYEILSSFDADAQPIAPESVDWKAVAAGKATVAMRQLPGPANSMGQMKFAFANNAGIYMHDSPEKDLFAKDQRDLSNGCIRLQDAARLGRWLLGRDPEVASSAPEQQVALPTPVPVFVTYLTANANDGQLTFADSVFDQAGGAGGSSEIAAIH